MSRQDKAITERNAKALRELLKTPENKVCADCKRNDPRWASWNLGVFLCIRCSGIHRSMGTHISKVKSVDLDTWTPAQMESIQKWGNRLANKYWEAHLKAGHIPPDHKIDSFIRSKYETRRWALEGPPPDDPAVLDTDAPDPAQQSTQGQPIAIPPVQNKAPAVAAARHQLLSTTFQQQPQLQQLQPPATQQQPQAPVAQAPTPPQSDLFSLDFHSPTPPTSTTPAGQIAAASRNPKQDIMSLFSSSPPKQPQVQTLWSQPQQHPAQQQPQVQQQSMMGTNGTGMWGVTSGWGQQQQQSQAVWGDFTGGASGGVTMGMGQQQAQPHMQMSAQPQTQFGGQPQQQQLFGTNDIWASSAPAPTTSNGTGGHKDAFDDIWGGFK